LTKQALYAIIKSSNEKGVIKMDLNTDFSYMTNEELDELISRIKEAKERRSESRKADLWNNVRRAVNNYIIDFGMIELFTEGHSFMLDDNSFSIPGEINPLD
jgi:hypothetical protein